MQYKNWYLQDALQNNPINIVSIFDFVFKLFCEIFGEETMQKEFCIVYNDVNAKCPMLVTSLNPLRLRLNIDGYEYWCQYIFQLSHELTHYACRQFKRDKLSHISWFEETVCEAMSLYILEIAACRWNECALSKINPIYAQSLLKYKDDEFNKIEKSILAQCTTLDELQKIDLTCTEERNKRSFERNYLYNVFKEMPQDIKSILFYSQYIKDLLLVDFDKWQTDRAVDRPLIEKLKAVQPKIA